MVTIKTENGTMRDVRETAFNTYQGSQIMTFFSEQERWINKLKRLKEKYPNEINIIVENKEDGSIVAECPISWMKFSPPRQMTEEQKQAASERLRIGRENHTIDNK